MELSAFKRNNFILYKLIPCLIITMFAIMCLYGSKVYAVDDITLDGVTFKFDNLSESQSWDVDSWGDFNNLTILRFDISNDKYRYYAFYSLYPIYIEDLSTSSYVYSYDSNNNNTRFMYKSIDKYKSDTSVTFQGRNVISSCGMDSPTKYTMNVLSSNNSVYLDNEVVFQLAPQSTLAPIVEQQEMKPLQEILGILPVVIVVLVGLIAIRKGIQFLMARMKKA